jgi:hypothetical protein
MNKPVRSGVSGLNNYNTAGIPTVFLIGKNGHLTN